jgi:hypothetical protein
MWSFTGSDVKEGEESSSHSRLASAWQATRADRGGAATELTADQRARLNSIARGAPPQGWTKWTLRLLAEELISQGVVSMITPDDIWRAFVDEVPVKS